MARRFRLFNQFCLLGLLLMLPSMERPAFAAPTPSPTAQPPHPAPAPPQAPAPPAAKPKPQKPDDWGAARKLFEELPPDQQSKFLQNLDQWKAMPPEAQELFRASELFRREKIAQEIQEAIGKSGLRLDEDQREVYALRYAQERRKIEEALRKEMDQKRQVMVNEMLSRLKVEFTVAPPPPAKALPSP